MDRDISWSQNLRILYTLWILSMLDSPKYVKYLSCCEKELIWTLIANRNPFFFSIVYHDIKNLSHVYV